MTPRGSEVGRIEPPPVVPLVGDEVTDAAGQSIGTISDVILDVSSGRTTHVLLTIEGVLGLESREFAVRRDALALRNLPQAESDTGRRAFVLNIDRDEVRFPDTATLLLV